MWPRRRLLLHATTVSIFLLIFVHVCRRYMYVWFGVNLIPTDIERGRGHQRLGRHSAATPPLLSSSLVGYQQHGRKSTDDVIRRQLPPPPSLLSAQERDTVTEATARRSLDYCNTLPPTPSADVITDEGHLPDGLRLVGVVIITRHGHRAPMYSLPNHRPTTLNCDMRHVQSSAADRDQALQFASAVDALVPQRNMRPQNSTVDGAWSRYGLYPSTVTGCTGAQLTADGALQMIRVGLLLRTRARYHKLAQSGVEVRSSEYSRTVQSAAALLYGLAGLSTALIQSSRVQLTRDVHLCLEHTATVMCDCRAARMMVSEGRRRAGRATNSDEWRVRREVANVLNVSSSRLPWTTAILEVLMSEFCINSSLPCDSTRHQCLSPSHLDRMWQVVDHSGRRDATDLEMSRAWLLLTYPLLVDVTGRLRDMAAADLGTPPPQEVPQPQPAHLVVFSGHDKTLKTLLAGLGLPGAGRWPAFGARLVFELSAAANGRPKYYFRLLYDGRDVSSSLHFCQERSVEGSGSACLLDNLVDAVFYHTSKWFGFASHVKACALS